MELGAPYHDNKFPTCFNWWKKHQPKNYAVCKLTTTRRVMLIACNFSQMFWINRWRPTAELVCNERVLLNGNFCRFYLLTDDVPRKLIGWEFSMQLSPKPFAKSTRTVVKSNSEFENVVTLKVVTTLRFESSIMTCAAVMREIRSFFANRTIRHPDIANDELLQDCRQ